MKPMTVAKPRRLPDFKFLNYAGTSPVTLVRIDFANMGGASDYALVHSAEELEQLINKCPPRARVSVLYPGYADFDDTVYVPDADGKLNPGAY